MLALTMMNVVAKLSSSRAAWTVFGLREAINNQNSVIIYKIHEGYPSAVQTDLKVGMKVLSINGKKIRSLDLAAYLLKEAGEIVSILVEEFEGRSRAVFLSERRGNRQLNSIEEVASDCDSTDDSCIYDHVIDGRIHVKYAPSKAEARELLQPCPPPGLPPGGVWGTHTYSGRDTLKHAAYTSLLFGEGVGMCMYCCSPEDELPAYKVDGWVYEQDGSGLGSARTTDFEPAKIAQECDGNGRHTHWYITK